MEGMNERSILLFIKKNAITDMRKLGYMVTIGMFGEYVETTIRARLQSREDLHVSSILIKNMKQRTERIHRYSA
jgi:hypothetical protein